MIRILFVGCMISSLQSFYEICERLIFVLVNLFRGEEIVTKIGIPKDTNGWPISKNAFNVSELKLSTTKSFITEGR